MDRKKRGSPAPVKYAPVRVTPLPATGEERDSHLRGFIDRFIAPHARVRWTHCLLERPEKAREKMHRFEWDHDPRCCVELKGAASFPEFLIAQFGPAVGLYFDGDGDPCKLTAAEAATRAAEECSDALWSLSPGKQALFFHHSGHAWQCERGGPLARSPGRADGGRS
jgi:hypothetical protein